MSDQLARLVGYARPARQAVDAFNAEVDPEKRVALWAEVQKVIYDEVPSIKIGDFNALSAQSPKLEGCHAGAMALFLERIAEAMSAGCNGRGPGMCRPATMLQ